MLTCLTLTAYRSLTTLTFATLGLHPHIQVMNHGFASVEASGALALFEAPDDAGLDRLARTLHRLSLGGTAGQEGGNIRFSHAFAFDHIAMRDAYATLNGDRLAKSPVRVVAWKEGSRLREHLIARGVDPIALAARFDRLRFVNPIRDPIDQACALHGFHAEPGLHPVPASLGTTDLPAIMRYVLRAAAEAYDAAQRRPDRFLCFTEREIGLALLRRLADFLEVEPSGAWLAAALSAFRVTRSYPRLPEPIRLLDRLLGEAYHDRPDFVAFIREQALRSGTAA
jgi:hypothetical protein